MQIEVHVLSIAITEAQSSKLSNLNFQTYIFKK